MAPRRSHGRFLVPGLALTLTIELCLVALAIGPTTLAGRAQPDVAPAAPPSVLGGPLEQVATHPADRLTIFRGGAPRWLTTGDRFAVVRVVPSSPKTPAAIQNVAVAATSPNPAAAKSAGPASGSGTAPAATYRGRNHVWMPSLGVSRSVSFYSCSRSTALANVVYRWGCAGRNNVYLMGHAWGVFKPLHDAYYNGRLRKGMQVIYADNNGRVTRYRVTFWKVVSPVGAEWAFASQSRPSMTLQTCVGRNSQYRLVVRLVASG